MWRLIAAASCLWLLSGAAAAYAEKECTPVPVVALDGDASFANLQTRTPIPLRSGSRVARYEIHATLDPRERTVRAGQRLHWRNRSTAAICTLYLHLDFNAFEGYGSRYLSRLHARGRAPEVGRGEWGYSQITQIRQSGAQARWTYVQSGDGPATDRSVVRVDLPQPVPAGATTTLELGFVARLPGDWAQSGYKDGFVFAGRWFPQVATLQLPGERGAPELRWNAPALAADPVERERADFDVELDVPYDYVAVSSGTTRLASRMRNGRRLYRFVQENAATLAWAADSRFFAQPLEYPFVSADGKWVKVRVFYRPGSAGTAVGALGKIAEALTHYTAALGAYPDPVLTTVVAPIGTGTLARQSHAGLLVAAADTRTGARADLALQRHVLASIAGRYLPEGTDEAFQAGAKRYWSERFTRNRFDASAHDRNWLRSLVAPWFALASVQWTRMRSAQDPDEARVAHIAAVLHDLEARVGAEAIDRAFRAWRRSARAGFPDTGQVRWLMADGSGHAEAFLQAFDIIDSGLRVDDRIVRFVSEERLPQPGYVLQGANRTELSEADVRRTVREARERWTLARSGAGPYPYRTEVVVRRDGAFVPQTLIVRFADGSTREMRWEDRRNPVRFEWTTPAPAIAVQLDPQRQVRLDRNKLDDGRTLQRDPQAARRWSEELASFVQFAATWIQML